MLRAFVNLSTTSLLAGYVASKTEKGRWHESTAPNLIVLATYKTLLTGSCQLGILYAQDTTNGNGPVGFASRSLIVLASRLQASNSPPTYGNSLRSKFQRRLGGNVL